LIAAILGVVTLLAAASIAAAATIEGTNSTSAWTGTPATIDAGESVTFKNSSTSIPHGVAFDAPPATPSCTGVVGSPGQTNWQGSCTFTQPGDYDFHCTVHAGMTGEVKVNSTGPGPPTPITGSATSVSDTGATLGGTVNPNGQNTEYFFKYGETTGYGQTTGKVGAGSGTSAVPASIGVTGLTPGATYHFRLFAENTSGTVEGADKTFTTTGPPLATTNPATGVSDVGATLQGNVNPRGHPTNYFFEYGTTVAYDQKTTVKFAGAGTSGVGVSAAVTGLTPGTTYHFRLVAKNDVPVEVPGADRTFTTLTTPPPPPPPDPLPTPITPVITPPPPVTPPDTKITLKPAAKTKDRTPTFKFKSTVAGATFKCTLDAKALKPCRSPLTTKKLSFGRHTLKVSAVVVGGSDPTPAAFSFKVLKP
jgi:plastocyanin